jgi:ribosomal protein S18 acetylase RimI-like enzyme
MSLRRIRPAVAADYPAFVRLFPELAVDDPMLEQDRFDREIVPTTLVMEAGEGPDPAHIVGYAHYMHMRGVTYVRHIVTTPEVRQTGVGRALMEAIAEIARAAGSTSWCLNVKPLNVAAIALYRRVGMAQIWESQALKLDWAIADAAPRMQNARIKARVIEPSDDARVEPAMKLITGQLALARAWEGRVLVGLFEGDDAGDDPAVLGAAVIHPHYPSAYPFRVARPELAFELLHAIRPHMRATDELVHVVIEGQVDVADALLAAGATLKMESVHMKGTVPPPGQR